MYTFLVSRLRVLWYARDMCGMLSHLVVYRTHVEVDLLIPHKQVQCVVRQRYVMVAARGQLPACFGVCTRAGVRKQGFAAWVRKRADRNTDYKQRDECTLVLGPGSAVV